MTQTFYFYYHGLSIGNRRTNAKSMHDPRAKRVDKTILPDLAVYEITVDEYKNMSLAELAKKYPDTAPAKEIESAITYYDQTLIEAVRRAKQNALVEAEAICITVANNFLLVGNNPDAADMCAKKIEELRTGVKNDEPTD